MVREADHGPRADDSCDQVRERRGVIYGRKTHPLTTSRHGKWNRRSAPAERMGGIGEAFSQTRIVIPIACEESLTSCESARSMYLSNAH
jgi:hypothetical protein